MPQTNKNKRAKLLLGSAMGLALLTLALTIEPQRPHVPSASQVKVESTQAAIQTPTLTSLPKSSPAAKKQILQRFNQLPLTFEANKGQTDSKVKFLARGSGYTLYLTPEEAVLVLRKPAKKKSTEDNPKTSSELRATNVQGAVLRMNFPGANKNPVVKGSSKLPGTSNYFRGKDSKNWVTKAAHFSKVTYSEVFPGIDVVYYGRQGVLEYDFVVAPGADPYQIALAFEGLVQKDGNTFEIDKKGNLLLHTDGGTVIQQAPVVYQKSMLGKREQVSAKYVEKTDGTIGFQVAAYDKKRTLVIDPIIVYSTYFGGASLSSFGQDVTADASGNAYVTGDTQQTDFPTAGTPFQAALSLGNDAFVTQILADGSAIGFSTYLGGTQSDVANAIAVDSSGNVYVVGDTQSSDFPILGGFQSVLGGGSDAFITKLGPGGSALLYSSFHGGLSNDRGHGLGLNGPDSMFVVGETASITLTTAGSPLQGTYGGGTTDGFAAVISTTASGPGSLTYATFIGGTADDVCKAAAIDSSNDAYIVGHTTSADFPTAGLPFQSALGGVRDLFVSKVTNSTGALAYSTYLGGTLGETATTSGIAVDSTGQAYVTGTTLSSDFPVLNAFQGTLSGSQDAVAACLATDGTSLAWSTFLGGSGIESGQGIGVDSDGNTHVGGNTNSSSDFPLNNAAQLSFGGVGDAFITTFPPITTTLILGNSTFLGGDSDEFLEGLGVDSQGNIYAVGGTNSTTYPVTNTFAVTQTGSFNVFLAKYATVVGGPAPTPTTDTQTIANLSASRTEGATPFVTVLDGSLSTAPTTFTINQYFWDFGDGSTANTASSSITHTYTTSGSYVAKLRVQSSNGMATEVSDDDILAIYAGDGVAGDGDLFINKAKVTLNRGTPGTDAFSFDGVINPNGFPDPLTGVTVNLLINGVTVTTPFSVSSRSAKATSRAGSNSIALISPKTGKIKIVAKNIDLQATLPVADTTATDQEERMEIQVQISGVPTANTPNVKSVIKSSFKSKKGKKSTGSFSFIKLPTFSGTFKSLKTSAKQATAGGFQISALGPIQADLSGPFTPTGDVTITIGGDGTPSTGVDIVIPFAAFKIKNPGAGSSFTYSKKLQEVTTLKKFQINNKRRKFVLATNELVGTGIPATGTGINVFALRIFISAPTLSGTLGFSTNIEIKRTNDTTTKWKR